jgi:hypothetical protein
MTARKQDQPSSKATVVLLGSILLGTVVGIVSAKMVDLLSIRLDKMSYSSHGSGGDSDAGQLRHGHGQ